ncbi:hypothetical protein CRG98_020222 [Punica granatum]|uniref:sulfiredoxin n=1 Tax=Punica granatum TaxID=22663 RepID=A0A2I0JT00_PUNGR|nr:hypothetical protein CRG98_020222 [Punica granatum]
MAYFTVPFPSRLRSFSVSASSNGSPPPVGTSQSQTPGPVILELPLDKIRRPLMRTRANDPNKVKELMDSIEEIGLQVPIDVLEVDGAYYGACLPQLLSHILSQFAVNVFQVAIGTKLIGDSVSQPYAVKFVVERRKHSDMGDAGLVGHIVRLSDQEKDLIRIKMGANNTEKRIVRIHEVPKKGRRASHP